MRFRFLLAVILAKSRGIGALVEMAGVFSKVLELWGRQVLRLRNVETAQQMDLEVDGDLVVLEPFPYVKVVWKG